MIIAENPVKVPGKRFKIKVSCVSTRRLTTLEWLLLSCAKKFSHSGYGVKEVFEKVFQFQNSELLIKPCLKSLSDLKVIRFSTGEMYDYAKLKFSGFQLTELGQVMLKDGLLPGEEREIPLDVYYNPLTGKVTTSDSQFISKTTEIEFGTESDYNLDFPEESIISGLQSGAVASGKFMAAKYRIENIERISEQDWSVNTEISVDLGDDGILSTLPEIVEPRMYANVRNILMAKDIPEKTLSRLTPLDTVVPSRIIGSGLNIKQAVQEICKNSKVLFIHSSIYDAYKKNTTFFKDKIVVVYDEDKNIQIEIKQKKKEVTKFIYVPDKPQIDGVVIMNEKEESLSICKAEWEYKGKKITVPVAIEDNRMEIKNKMLSSWMDQLVQNKVLDDINYLILASLPGIKTNHKVIRNLISNKWADASIQKIVVDCKVFKNAYEKLDIVPINLVQLVSVWEDKIDYANPDVALEELNECVASRMIPKGSSAHVRIAGSILDVTEKPQNYVELIQMVQKLGIGSYEEALVFSSIEDKFYTKEIVKDVLREFTLKGEVKIPVLFNWDIFLSDYINCIRYVEAHISGLNIFDKANKEDLNKAIKFCPNIASLKMYFSELLSKNEYLMEEGINVHEVMASVDLNKADAIFENITNIEEILAKTIDSVYSSAKTKAIKNGSVSKQKVYVLDTCALIHNPKLWLFFGDEDYIRIPTKVIDELGKIKDRRSDKYSGDVAYTARMVAKNINEEYMLLFNAKNSIRLLIENADLDLLPDDLDPKVPDNQILSVALKYADCDTTIISDDNVFLLTSVSQNIKSMTGEAFIEANRGNYKSLEDRKKSIKVQLPTLIQLSEKGEQEEKKELDIDSKLSVDDLHLKEIMKYAPELTNPMMSLLNTNQIKTVGQFRKLTPEMVESLKAKGTQTVYKNTIKYAVAKMDQIMEKLATDYN